MPQNAFFIRTRGLLISPKTTQRQFLFTLHLLSTVIFATATVLAFVLLRNSNFNFDCYTQREATPTQKSARKCAATSRDFFRERLQSAFTLANQLRWIACFFFSFSSFCFSGYSVHLRCTSERGSLVSVCCPAMLLSLLSGLYRVHGLRVSSLCHVARWHFLPPLSFQKVFVCCCRRCFLCLLFQHTSFVFIFGLLAKS